jgi:hypothetical protein
VRSLLVATLAAVALATAAGHATAAGAAPAMSLSPKAGDAITQTQLLGYLFVAPQSGDWLRFRVSVDGTTLLVKTVGFGSETLHDTQRAYVETRTQTIGLAGQPVSSNNVAGGELIWKMYVDAPNFDDPTRSYAFVAGVIKICDAVFRLSTGPGQPLSAPAQTLESLALYGALPLPDDRSGTVAASQPENIRVGDANLQAVHTTVDFAARSIGMANGLPQARVEAWQTTDVPLGVVAVRSTTNGHIYSVDLIAYGRGTYRSLITEQFDDIPPFPG